MSSPEMKLGEVVYSDRKVTYGIVQPGDFCADGIPLIRGMDYSNGWAPIDKFFRVHPEVDKPYKRSKVRPNDILLTIVGAGTGNLEIVPEYLNDANITQTTARISVDPKIMNYKYVFYCLQSPYGRKQIKKYIKGGAQPGLNLGDIENFKILVKDRSEQNKIALTLETWDRSLKLLNDQKKLVELKLQDAIDNLITVKDENCFIDKKSIVSDNIKFIGGSQPPRSEFIFEPKNGYIRLLQIRDYKTDNFQTYIPLSMSKRFCDVDDVMIGRYGPPIFQILRGKKGSYNVALIKAEPKSDRISKDYIYYFLRNSKLFNLIDGLSKRSAGQTGIDIAALNSFKMPTPTKKFEKSIVGLLNCLNREVDLLDQLIQNVDLQKRGLLEHIFGGWHD